MTNERVGPRRRGALSLFIATAAALAATVGGAAGAESVEDKVAVCAGCHGDNGIPMDTAWPVIWGQQQGYVYLQLRDFKSGARKSDIMAAIVKDLERDDMLAIALYFSQKKWPDLQQPHANAETAAKADRANTAVGCTGCHQGEYQGEGTQPRLAGQNQEYLEQSMLAFRNRMRANNPGMSDLMMTIAPDDIKALATYLAGRSVQ